MERKVVEVRRVAGMKNFTAFHKEMEVEIMTGIWNC
jgi:hypothetical protein